MAYTTINKHTNYFNTKLYSGNGSTQNITGVGFQPDLIWQKERTSTSYHVLTDVIRGNTKQFFPNVTAVEATDSNYITSFDSDGFGQGQNNDTNQSGQTYVAWNWKAGGAGSANTAGTINSTVSVNTTAGCSIVSYTGTGANATVGHGLGVAPAFYMVKSRNNAYDWRCYHKSLGNGKYIDLNSTAAVATNSNAWNNTSPTSTVFSLSTGSTPNASGGTFVAYCFAEKTGFSKFGSYEGNGSTNGTFVYTGFKPKFIIIKDADNVRNWYLTDAVRDPINYVRNTLTPNTAEAEFVNANYNRVDFLSNGFKLRGGASGVGNDTNGSGNTYIYMAFGQSLVGSNNVPCTAR